MQLKALAICIATAAVLNVHLSAADEPGVPRGWSTSDTVGSVYAVGYDNAEKATYLRSIGDPGEQKGALFQSVDMKPYLGRTVRASAELRDDSFTGRVEFFLNATGNPKPDGKRNNSFAVSTVEAKPGVWQPVNMVIRYDNDTVNPLILMTVGLAIHGKGGVWMRNVQIVDVTDNKEFQREATNKPISADISSTAPNVSLTNLELRP